MEWVAGVRDRRNDFPWFSYSEGKSGVGWFFISA
jgi:hypothetical protein